MGSWLRARRGRQRAEMSLMKIMTELSYLNPRIEESNVFALDDPELCSIPSPT